MNARVDQKAPQCVDNNMETKRTLLNILSWNTKGFRETIDGVKINKLKDRQFIHKLVDYDLVFLQETHLDKDNIGDVGLPGFAPAKRLQAVYLYLSKRHYDPLLKSYRKVTVT